VARIGRVRRRQLARCDDVRIWARLGDLGALVREEQHLRQALRRAQQANGADWGPEDATRAPEPQRQTVALFEQLRGELEQTERAAVPVAA
jgi:hypothetical protein